MSKRIGKILCICGVLLLWEPRLSDRMYLHNQMMGLFNDWQFGLILLGFFLMNRKSERKSHR